jgi:GT2 family glycosyltransferase
MRLPWRRAAVERAAWLSDDTLLTIGWCTVALGPVAARIESNGALHDVDARWCAYPRPDVDAPGGAGRVSLYRFPSPLDRFKSGTLRVRSGNAEWTADMRRLQHPGASLADTVARGVGWLDPGTRAEILAFLLNVLDTGGTSVVQLANGLARVRDILRAPLPEHDADSGEPCSARLEVVVRIDDKGCYVRGWVSAATSPPVAVTAVSPEGTRVDVLDTAFRYRRPDLDVHRGADTDTWGIAAFVDLPHPTLVRDGWLLELTTRDGRACQSPACPAQVVGAAAARDILLADVELDRGLRGRLIERHIDPAARRLSAALAGAAASAEVFEFGAPAPDPIVSVIVPQFRRLDLMEPQIAQFALDDDLRRADLLFVLDSPELAEDFLERARQLQGLYGLSYRAVVLSRNSGFALANNAAAGLARGRLLLLLNSDVFPAQPGWLARLAAFYQATPNIGALGPKLLYEDDTLQHAGMYFRREPETGIWENQHYFKGLHRTYPAANIPRRVPAVTGACLMIARALYAEQQGLRGGYVRGDYEDSDLCLRLLAAGYENWYLPTVEMYHLEGQSYGWADRSGASRYNAWTHTQLWDAAIEQAMARSGA